MSKEVLAINPGSTSTKVSLFAGDSEVLFREIRHDKEQLSRYQMVADQLDMRIAMVNRELEGVDTTKVAAVAGRGGLLHPLEGGVYEVSDKMISELMAAQYGEHPSNLGAPMARSLARQWGVPAYMVDPVVTDELEDRARLTGLPCIERRSLFHALNQRGAARAAAKRLGVRYEEVDMLVVHLGGGISMGAHRKGRVVEVVNALDGEGPMSPERTGGLPLIPVMSLLEKGDISFQDLRLKVLRQGGLFAHLGTNSFEEVEARIEQGDALAVRVFEAMAYSIARHLASLAPALVDDRGDIRVASVVLTGGMARSGLLTREVARQVSFLGPVEVVVGNEEMMALAHGVQRVLERHEQSKAY